MIIDFVYSNKNIVSSIFPDKYGFYIIHKVLSMLDEAKQKILTNIVAINICNLNRQPFGNKYLRKLIHDFPIFKEDLKNNDNDFSNINTNDNDKYSSNDNEDI